MDYAYRQHHERFKRYVEAHGLRCQACGGRGQHGSNYSYYEGPEPCGWCETTGLVTRWLRGLYLTTMREEKRRRRKVAEGRAQADRVVLAQIGAGR